MVFFFERGGLQMIKIIIATSSLYSGCLHASNVTVGISRIKGSFLACFYKNIYSSILTDMKATPKFKYFPAKRTLEEIKNGNIDIDAGRVASLNTFGNKLTLSEEIIYQDFISAVSFKKIELLEKSWLSVTELLDKGFNPVAVRGFVAVSKNLKKDTYKKIMLVTNVKNGVNRINNNVNKFKFVLIHPESSYIDYVNKLKRKYWSHRISEHNLYTVFNKKSIYLKSSFEKKLREYKKNGEYEIIKKKSINANNGC